MNELFTQIDPFQINENVFDLLDKKWMLVTAGIENNFNTMTASWGGMGILWNMPVAYVFIRPQRYTYEFAEKHEKLTLSFFKEEYRKALNICGSISGRNSDKIKKAGLTPMIINSGSISFDECYLFMDCIKLYYSDVNPENFCDPAIDKNYPLKDYHRMYIYKIIACYHNKLVKSTR